MSHSFAPDTPLPCSVASSPNHGDRKGRMVDAIILHYTDMPTADAALAVLRNPATEVSSHYLIDEQGGLIQLVPESRRAWHAGRSYWQGERDLNSVSVGIEIANAGLRGGFPAFPDRQIEAVIALCWDIVQRHGVAPDRILAHSDIAPGRKVDPGPRFPWERLFADGTRRMARCRTDGLPPISLALGATGARVAALQTALAAWGPDVSVTGQFDRMTRTAVSAFQLHFRPARTDGVADGETCALLTTLLHQRNEFFAAAHPS